MKIGIIPKTTLGKWSVGLVGGLIIFFALLLLMVAIGQRGGETFFSNLALAIPGMLAALSGIAGFFTGIVSIIKSKDHSLLVLLSTGIGLVVLIFCLGEFLFPH
jgi:hypothetical protein